MSYCRTTIVEFNSEKDADECSANYSKMLLRNYRKKKYYLLSEQDLPVL
jgi:hypothetical protein